jgi:hypothetical protein
VAGIKTGWPDVSWLAMGWWQPLFFFKASKNGLSEFGMIEFQAALGALVGSL